MPLSNCKVELKLKWARHYVLATASIVNTNGSPNNIIFTIKDRIICPVAAFSAKDNHKLPKLSKGFEKSMYWNNYQTKSGNKNSTNKYRYFLESNFVAVN